MTQASRIFSCSRTVHLRWPLKPGIRPKFEVVRTARPIRRAFFVETRSSERPPRRDQNRGAMSRTGEGAVSAEGPVKAGETHLSTL